MFYLVSQTTLPHLLPPSLPIFFFFLIIKYFFPIDERSRLAGEEASHEMMSEHLIPFISELFGRSFQEISSFDFYPHTKLQFQEVENILYLKVKYNGEDKFISTTAILAIFINQLVTEISATFSVDKLPILVFPLPHGYTPTMERAIHEACIIAGVLPIPENKESFENLKHLSNQVVVLNAADCLVRAYSRKLSALKGIEASQLEGRLVLLVEMGHVHTTVVIVRPCADLQSVVTERVLHSSHVGSFQFDCAIYENLKNSIEQKHHCNVCYLILPLPLILIVTNISNKKILLLI